MWPNNESPPAVIKWLDEHEDCEEMKDHFHYGFHVYVFYDDMAATEFKLRFKPLFPT